jgi:hypothetical protein
MNISLHRLQFGHHGHGLGSDPEGMRKRNTAARRSDGRAGQGGYLALAPVIVRPTSSLGGAAGATAALADAQNAAEGLVRRTGNQLPPMVCERILQASLV